MNMIEYFQTVVRVRGTDKWQPVLYYGERYYVEDYYFDVLDKMTNIMAENFPENEYKIEAISI